MKILPLILALLIVIPVVSFAAWTPGQSIVPECTAACGCGFGEFSKLVQNVLDLMVYLGFFIIVLVISYAGWTFMTNPTQAGKRTEARKMVLHSLIGFVILLASFLIVETIFAVFAKPDYGWNNIFDTTVETKCPEAKPVFVGVPDIVVDDGPSGPGCTNCTSINRGGISCKDADSCTTDPTFGDKLVTLNNTADLRITEAFPPTRSHVGECHQNGTCVDATFQALGDMTNATKVADFITAASNQGLCAVFETTNASISSQVNARLGEGVNGSSLSLRTCSSSADTQCITRPHFSIYANPSLAPSNCSR